MARRRRKQNKSFLDELLDAPWQVSIVVGVLAFMGLRWIFPGVTGGNTLLRPIAQAAPELAWWAAGFFFLIGAIIYSKAAASKSKIESATLVRGASGGYSVSCWRQPISTHMRLPTTIELRSSMAKRCWQ